MPSFIWFDEAMLQFSQVVGVQESITYGPGQFESKTLRLTDPEHAANPYDLLIDSIDARRAELYKVAQATQSNTGYASASVNQVSQHCILFAPDFDQPILQPPPNAEAELENE